MKTFRIGTRGSPLALAQSGQIRDILAARWTEWTFEMVTIRTTGDAWALKPGATPPPGKGIFTKELEEALISGAIDLAIHSLKDLPVDGIESLPIVSIPVRANWRDVLIRRKGEKGSLPQGAVVATGSPRRQAQLKKWRPDLSCVDVRGNIDTRLRKFSENTTWSGLVLAAAGLERLKPDLSAFDLEFLEADRMMPAPGQGALGLQMRRDDEKRFIAEAIHDQPTALAVNAERGFLSGLGGGCQWPAAALAVIENETMHLQGFYLTPDHQSLQGNMSGPASNGAELGRSLAEALLKNMKSETSASKLKQGKAYLVGAGPGDPGLLTIRARELIERADLIIYDYLCNPEILKWAKPETERLYAGKKSRNHTLTQDQINEALVTAVEAGKCVVRLKGGDPYIFGRGGEEGQALFARQLAFEIVPGISSAIAAPAYAGIPVTHRDHASTVTFVTGHERPDKADSAIDWQSLARLQGTKVFLMGVERIASIADALMSAGAATSTPVALIRWGTWGKQQVLEGTLGTIAALCAEKNFQPPAVCVVGTVVGLRKELDWFGRRPLFGKRIVVTRTRTQASALTARLQELGAEVLEVPTIKIQPRKLDSDQEAKLKNLSAHADWLVFTSPNAVDIFMEHVQRLCGDIRALGPVPIASVGAGTTSKLREYRLAVAHQPKTFTTQALGESFLPEQVSGKRICLPRASEGNPELSRLLAEKGAKLWEWTLYDTVQETEDINGHRERYIQEGADWILFTSSSTVTHWNALELKPCAEARQPKLGSIGPVTTQTMKNLGLPVELEAAVHTIPGLVNALLDYKLNS